MGRTLVALASAGLLTVGGASASAQSAGFTGVMDFQISTVGEGLGGLLFPETVRRNANKSRFQVNGRNPDPSDRNFGQWTTFDLDFNGLFVVPITQLQTVTVDLFQAQPITGQTINNVIDGGTLNLYYTTEDADVLDAGNGFDWIDADPEGLGPQFADRVLVGSVDLVAGNFDVSFNVDLTSIESSLVSAINADGFGRFVLTSPTPEFASSWGVGVSGDPEGILEFDGAAPVVTFTVPSPGAAAMLALAGIAGVRRRRG